MIAIQEMSVAKKRAPDQPKKKADPRVRAALATIARHMSDVGLTTYEALAKAAGHGVQTWHGWQNGHRRPKFLDLDDFARAVKLTVRPVLDPAQASGDSRNTESGGVGAGMTPESIQIAHHVDELPEDQRERVRDLVLKTVEHYKRSEAANPQEPGEEHRSHHARRK